ncbi:GntR family transcriptional regulator [Verticiella sediminum]|uniref:GntR family transcriptional regulator n=1 Tax=Verticiella sediminum TaxID=1247510 RepID=A0A556B1Z6_9BURK|nr:GntR family transcriptional regulator [Verticiella sediminum]TSH99211.1 GntR family transcriptional regulator [Verticiella sediminum]
MQLDKENETVEIAEVPRDAGLPNLPQLDRNSPLPLYEQIKRRVLTMVLNWTDPESRFHTDQELAEQFGVSRMTVRQAVQELVNEGRLRRVRGLGTYVCETKVDEQFTPAMDFLDQAASKGRPIHLRILHCEKMPVPAGERDSLRLNAGDLVWYVIRLRSVDGVPISLDYRYIDAARVGDMALADLESGSILDLIGRHAELAYADLKVEAGRVEPEHAELLSLVAGDPVLIRSLIYFDHDERPVMSGVSYYRADQVRYSLRVPVQKGGPGQRQIADTLEVRR